jgi:hypothetical protein
MRKRPTYLLVTAAALFGLTGCPADDPGGDDPPATTVPATTTSTTLAATTTIRVDDADLVPFVDALAGSFELPGISEDTARCLSDAVVGVVGPQLIELSIDPEAFAQANTLPDLGIVVSPAAEVQLVAALDECDLGDYVASSLAAELSIDPVLSDIECVQVVVNETATVAAVLAASLAGDDGGRDALDAARIDALVACETFVEAVAIGAFEDGGEVMNDELRACYVAELDAMTPPELSAFLLGDPTGGTLTAELTDACAGFIGG